MKRMSIAKGGFLLGTKRVSELGDRFQHFPVLFPNTLQLDFGILLADTIRAERDTAERREACGEDDEDEDSCKKRREPQSRLILQFFF